MVSEQIKSLLMWEFMTENYTVTEILHANFYRYVTSRFIGAIFCKETEAVLKLFMEVRMYKYLFVLHLCMKMLL